MDYIRLIRDYDQQRTDRGMIDRSILIGLPVGPVSLSACPVVAGDRPLGYRVVLSNRFHRRGDEVLPRMCAQLSRHRETHTTETSGRYPQLTLI